MTKNRLAQETSPYLLQHAENPVDWYSWGAEALEKAVSENKPIFLSVGYSSCHWCHVMAHESFENQEIAEFMNKSFVNIKVDREERPDIDDIYQKACQMATGQGGWPLSAFLTPDQKPFHVGTYYPPLDSYGRPGFGSLCRHLAQAWEEKQSDVASRAQEFVTMLSKADNDTTAPELQASGTQNTDATDGAIFNRDILDEAAVNLYDNGDATYGGFGSAPKFPNAACISFLFRYAEYSGRHAFAKFALKTLDKMARGGIFDQLGGGFHRYSTDARWLVPHFEKMLYDNALIPVNYAEAYQITRNPFYLDVMKKTLDFVLSDMRSPEGGFYSAYDADSECAEGVYYTWKKQDILRILGSGADADLFCLYYDVTDGGNWEGQTILCNNIGLSTVAFKVGMDVDDARTSLAESAAKLLDARKKTRVPPGLDQKVLTSWNALFVSALAKGYAVSGKTEYLQAARDCLSFIESKMLGGGGDARHLKRTYKDGRAKIKAYLEDYAFLACAYLDVFEAHPDPRYLESAINLGRVIIEEFWDEPLGSFYMTSSHSDESLIIRPRNKYDLSIPSGSSVASYVALRLYHMTGERQFFDVCETAIGRQARACAENPFAFGYMTNVISTIIARPREITVLNPDADPDISNAIQTSHLPHSFTVMVRSADMLHRLSKYPFFAGKKFDEKRTSVYVCKDSVCSLPMHDKQQVRSALGVSDV